MLDYVDGGYNLPSERAVDELVAIAESRRAHGLHDRDEVMPNGQTLAEYVESSRVPALFSDAAIDAPWHPSPSPVGPVDGWRGWLRGGYNMPTERELDAAPPMTKRGAYRRPIPDGWIFADECPADYQRSLEILSEVPFPRPCGVDGRSGNAGPVMLPDVADVLGSYFGGCRRQYLSVFPGDDVGAARCEANAAVLFARARACLRVDVLPDDAGLLINMSEGSLEPDHFALLDLREHDVDCEDALDTVAALLAREGWSNGAGAEEAAEIVRRVLAGETT